MLRPKPWIASAIVSMLLAMLIFACPMATHAAPKPLRVVTADNYPPYLFIGPDGKARGYRADLWKLWSQKTGIPVQLEPMQWARAQYLMRNGQADVIDMIYRTPPREQLYDFSPPYATQTVGSQGKNDWNAGQAGFRLDWDATAQDGLSFRGAFHRTHIAEQVVGPPPVFAPQTAKLAGEGGFLSGRWQHRLAAGGETDLKVHYDSEDRAGQFRFQTLDLDFQHSLRPSARQLLVWGGGYRHYHDNLKKGLAGGYTFAPESRTLQLYSLFIQDTLQLVPERLHLTVGSKYEHNDFTGSEFQPTIRLLWMPDASQSLWGAVSRAVRTPSRLDVDSSNTESLPPVPGGGPPQQINLEGSKDFASEELIAYEAGYRLRPTPELGFDLATFFNDYDQLSAYEGIGPGQYRLSNRLAGKSYGLELVADWRVAPWWRLTASWSWLRMKFHVKAGAAPVLDYTSYLADSNPRDQGFLRSSWDIGGSWSFDVALRYVDGVQYLRNPNALLPNPARVDAYVAVDSTVIWKATEHLELALIGRNIGTAHQEANGYEEPSSGYLKATWNY